MNVKKMFFPFKFGGEYHFPKLQGKGVLFAPNFLFFERIIIVLGD